MLLFESGSVQTTSSDDSNWSSTAYVTNKKRSLELGQWLKLVIPREDVTCVSQKIISGYVWNRNIQASKFIVVKSGGWVLSYHGKKNVFIKALLEISRLSEDNIYILHDLFIS